MKKYIISLLIIFLLSLFINNEETKLVFNDIEEEYSMYILQFPNHNMSTNNINLFKDIKIIWIKPYINNLYKNKLNYKIYYFEDISLDKNIDKFKNQFIDLLYINGYRNDAMNYKISGIKLEKMKVYCKEEDIKSINVENIKYKRVEI